MAETHQTAKKKVEASKYQPKKAEDVHGLLKLLKSFNARDRNTMIFNHHNLNCKITQIMT